MQRSPIQYFDIDLSIFFLLHEIRVVQTESYLCLFEFFSPSFTIPFIHIHISNVNTNVQRSHFTNYFGLLEGQRLGVGQKYWTFATFSNRSKKNKIQNYVLIKKAQIKGQRWKFQLTFPMVWRNVAMPSQRYTFFQHPLADKWWCYVQCMISIFRSDICGVWNLRCIYLGRQTHPASPKNENMNSILE